MKQLFFGVLSILLVISPPLISNAATPTLVQHVTGNNTGQRSSMSALVINLPNPTLAGNILILSLQHSYTLTMAGTDVTDNKGNTWYLGPRATDSTYAAVTILYAPNVAAGTLQITVSKNFGSGGGGVSADVSEFYNVATSSPLDTSTGAHVDSSTVAAGSMTTTSNGDLIYQTGMNDRVLRSNAQPWLTAITKGTNFTLLGADVVGGNGSQYYIQPSAGAINPTMVMNGSSNHYNTVAVAFKAATAGTAPGSGIRIVHIQGINLYDDTGSTSLPMQFPSTGNLLVLMWNGWNGNCDDITSISDNNSNTWVSTSSILCVSGAAGERYFYVANAATSTDLAITLNTAEVQWNSNAMFYDIVNAAASPFDSAATCPSSTPPCTASGSGNSSPYTTLTTVSITPSTANDIVLAQVAQSFCSSTGTYPPGNTTYLFDSMTFPEELDSLNFYEDQGGAHVYNTNTNQLTFEYLEPGCGGTGNWGAMAAAFKGTTTPISPSPPSNLSISGTVGVAGATITYTGTTSGSTSSSGSTGTYSITVSSGWSGTVTPTLTGYTFSPTSTTYTDVTSNQTTNYAATATTSENYTLTLLKSGTGTGTVTSSPSGNTCRSTCSSSYGNYASGTVVTLSAAPSSNSSFVGWSGACSGTGLCSVTMSSSETVTATFNLSSPPPRRPHSHG